MNDLKSVVICLTALNYVYSQLDPDIGCHDIICDNEELAEWIHKNQIFPFRKLYITKIQNKNLLKNHLISADEKDKWKEISKNRYDKFYLSFSSGWHFNWLQKKIKLNIKDCVILDDGTANLLINKTNFYYQKKFLSFLISGKKDSFSKYRDFNNKNVKKIVSIYKDLKIKKNFSSYEVIDITNFLSEYCLKKRQSNNVLLDEKYGVYLTSDRGAYYKDHKKIVRDVKRNLEKLENNTQMPWILKTKRTDPLRRMYLDNNLKLAPFTINQELMLDINLKNICTNYDSFLLNKKLLKLPVNIIVRDNEQTFLHHQEKVEILKKITEDSYNILI